MQVVKIELKGFGHYYERADNFQAIFGIIESHVEDSSGDVLCLSVENMKESEFKSLPEFMGF